MSDAYLKVKDNGAQGLALVREEVEAPVSAMTELPGGTMIDVTDFTDASASTIFVDTTNETVTVTTTSKGTYRSGQTSISFAQQNFVAGKAYRFHAKAETVSGTPTILVGIRGIEGNENGLAKSLRLSDGESGYIDFVANEYMRRVSLFVTFDTSASASVKFSELWLKAYDGDEKEALQAIRKTGASGFTKRLPLAASMFRANWWIPQTGGSGESRSYSIAGLRAITFRNLGGVHIYTENANLLIYVRTSDSSAWNVLNGGQDVYYNGEKSVFLNFETVDKSAFPSAYLDDIMIYSTEEVYRQYLADNFVVPTVSGRFPEAGTGEINKYGMIETGGQIGMAVGGASQKRITTKPWYCEKAVTVYCGHKGTGNCIKILHDGVLHTITESMWHTIPAGTIFMMSFYYNGGGPNVEVSNASMYVVDDSVPVTTASQALNIDFTPGRVDAAFVADDKIFTIAGENATYSVFEDGAFVKTAEPLDHSPGHANSCNYYNGKCYVSDWTDGTLIHVYAVDTDENTLAYEKDITMPSDDYGSVEYYVLNDEKEIFFLGWQSGNSSTSPNNLIYGLYILTTSGYELSYVKKAIRPTVMQGFTRQGNYLYYLNCEGSPNYYTISVNRIDMMTGLTAAYPMGGTLAQREPQAVIPVGNSTFLVVASNGHTFFVMLKP